MQTQIAVRVKSLLRVITAMAVPPASVSHEIHLFHGNSMGGIS